MKAKISFLLILLLSALGILPGAAQQHFNKRFTIGCSANYFANAIGRNNKYYSIAGGIDSINYAGGGLFYNKTGLKFCVFDSVGNLMISKLYQREDKLFTYVKPAGIPSSNNFFALPDGSFLHGFAVIDTATDIDKPSDRSTQFAIAQFDSLGNVLRYKEYARPYLKSGEPTNHILYDFKPDGNENWLMLGSVLSAGKVYYCLRKLDKDFNEVWVKILATKDSLSNVPKNLLIESDGYVVSGGLVNNNLSFFPNYYASFLTKYDTAGNQKWSWINEYDTTNIQFIINDVLRSKDGGLVYCGSGLGIPNYGGGDKHWSSVGYYGMIEKIDAANKPVWRRLLSTYRGLYETIGQTIIKELPDGDIMVAGAIGDDDTRLKGSLARLSGVDGSIVWHRKYKSPDGNDTMYLVINDMRQTADGGFILSGESKNEIDRGLGPIQRGWLIKVDSNGCLGAGDPQCDPTAITKVSVNKSAFKISPNPSTGSFTITPHAVIPQGSVNATVYDLLGRLIYNKQLDFSKNQTSINLDANNGIYILELSDADGEVYRQKVEVRQ